MCTVLDKVENKGREEGKLEGLAQGKLEGLAQGKLEGMIQVYYKELHYSADQIAGKRTLRWIGFRKSSVSLQSDCEGIKKQSIHGINTLLMTLRLRRNPEP